MLSSVPLTVLLFRVLNRPVLSLEGWNGSSVRVWPMVVPVPGMKCWLRWSPRCAWNWRNHGLRWSVLPGSSRKRGSGSLSLRRG
jgi:hypothetical protein